MDYFEWVCYKEGEGEKKENVMVVGNGGLFRY